MDVFRIRRDLIRAYADYISSFILIKDNKIKNHVSQCLTQGHLWPDPLIQLNPAFVSDEEDRLEQLVETGVLHEKCLEVFRTGKDELGGGKPLRFYRHQTDAIRAARGGYNYVLTTGTGSGKSLAYIVPIVDHVVRHGSGKGIQAIVVYPMNALANSQMEELAKFLSIGFPDKLGPVTFSRYTGQESDEERKQIVTNPPDVLLTNYVMLELLLTRPREKPLINAAKGLRFLVLDELHTYRGRQGADVSLLVRRVRDLLGSSNLQFIGTSATLAGSGSPDEQQTEVARIASDMFGAPVKPEHVIGETLKRAAAEQSLDDDEFRQKLIGRLQNGSTDYGSWDEFLADPLTSWVEEAFGVRQVADVLVRAHPKQISAAATGLAEYTGEDQPRCQRAIEQLLLDAHNTPSGQDGNERPFAFRIHQFISRGDTVYASLEADRYVTIHGQQRVPGKREKLLLPLLFCRECGQEYYCIHQKTDEHGESSLFPRRISERSEEGSEAGFIYFDPDNPWPSEISEIVKRVPEDWVEEGKDGLRIRRDRRRELPRQLFLGASGKQDPNGINCFFLGAPFRFCPNCGVSYDFSQQNDFGKLATLSSEGRSTATTILSFCIINELKKEESLSDVARKLLSFTDNRQDASLQAGHFNDFIEVSLLRGALYKAAEAAGAKGLAHDELAIAVSDALDLGLDEYAADPDVRYQAQAETKKALQDVIGYRLYRDLRRGWRVNLPNLEQVGLLTIKYTSLNELCGDDDVWVKLHPALAQASHNTREQVSSVLLDYMRRELLIKVPYLESSYQEQIKLKAGQRLAAPWFIDEYEKLLQAGMMYPRSRRQHDYKGNIYISGRSAFGQYLKRHATFPDFEGQLSTDDAQVIIRQLLDVTRLAGVTERVVEPRKEGDVAGYQVNAASLKWLAADGEKAYRDLVRVPSQPQDGLAVNSFFVGFYRTLALQLKNIRAKEHTAQVPAELRQEREKQFRAGRLPVLYCSPTMELGVDISQLNTVNMRNVPPTPANYAQRSGRAGRGGQPALVYTYCTTGSSHDHYYFNRPAEMVCGAVKPPRIDLANEDLVRSHVHAIWLSETGIDLGKTLTDVLDLTSDDAGLPLKAAISEQIANLYAQTQARTRAVSLLATLESELSRASWYYEGWLDDALNACIRRFDTACERWRELYRSAQHQQQVQNAIIGDHSRTPDVRKRAKRLWREAVSQIELLTMAERLAQSDFYSYRYFASEGFLPGYNFPRLPLSAFIPSRQKRFNYDDYVSRPRFLAITEFGPESIIYYEGSRYEVTQVHIPPSEEMLTSTAKVCDTCGYLHQSHSESGVDLCENCGVSLGVPLGNLLKMSNVTTRRRERISSDEEERQRRGYQLRTAVRFHEQDGKPNRQLAQIVEGDVALGTLSYGDSATLWRINVGWRRKPGTVPGFWLDRSNGKWLREKQALSNRDDPAAADPLRVVPYVEDYKNCLVLSLPEIHDATQYASLQAALKVGMQGYFQLEDNELAAEPLPGEDNRRSILFYEASEGGAGVLRQLMQPGILSQIARETLSRCHFDPLSGEDQGKAGVANETCEAACYHCLMTYRNQREHHLLDRHVIKDWLLRLAEAEVVASPVDEPRAVHLDKLKALAGSNLERTWLDFIDTKGLRLPDDAQLLIEQCGTRPDFVYSDYQVVIYIDGPPHDFPDRQQRDQEQSEVLSQAGYIVIRFGYQQDWLEVVSRHKGIFGGEA